MMDNKTISSLPGSPIYEWLGENDFVRGLVNSSKIYKTWSPRYKVYSKNSCSFADLKQPKEDDIRSIIKETFDITSPVFDEKFHEAISGDGQELKRIAVLHSSSLAALLCFYQVNEHPLTIKLNGVDCTFTKSFFECKNKVGKDEKGNIHYSNIDVILTGKNNNGDSVILFLESKFSEYLTGGKKEGISRFVYGDLYDKIEKIEGLTIKQKNKEITISSTSKKQHYCEGIKQMISHYLGITESFLNSYCNTYDNVCLGELLFHFDDEKTDSGMFDDYFDDYNTLYKQLSTNLNSISRQNNDKLIVLPEVLTYQSIFANNPILDKKVKEFYHL